MKAVVVHKYGGPEVLKSRTIRIRCQVLARCSCESPPRA